ncbi:hypothetical protein BGZ63DRAFT_350209 [Mariannaea sp. PMI_226]|nr:hypothetical protein BGZ63DRAFT_350209 [Mariannaea sp. PMI_226]
MPYNTRRKSLSLPSLGIHVPMTQAARAAAAASRASSRHSPSTPRVPSPPPSISESTDAHPSKRQKRSHGDGPVVEQTPPPSPPANSEEIVDTDKPTTIDLEGVNDDIVEAVIVQLQSTANRPHLVKELAIVLAQRLSSVQHSANPCAIISSRLASYLKRSCWTASAPCPLAKELEAVHPRRTYYFLTTCPRLSFPESSPIHSTSQSLVTPSVSLTDDSGSDDADTRRRELSPSPEVDLSPHQFEEEADDDLLMPITPIGSFSNQRSMLPRRISRHNSPPLEKDEREFTHTADTLQKRKFTQETPASDSSERIEYGYRDEIWFGDNRIFAPTTLMTSPSMKPSGVSSSISNITSSARKEDETDSWLKLSKLLEWEGGAESIEIDELDGLLDAY